MIPVIIIGYIWEAARLALRVSAAHGYQRPGISVIQNGTPAQGYYMYRTFYCTHTYYRGNGARITLNMRVMGNT